MSRFGIGELLIVLAIVLLLFGASRLPQLGKALADAIKEFKKAGKKEKGAEDEKK